MRFFLFAACAVLLEATSCKSNAPEQESEVLSGALAASEFSCFPSKNYDNQDRYTLKFLKGNKISLGSDPKKLKSGELQDNGTVNSNSDYIKKLGLPKMTQYGGGDLYELRGEGFVMIFVDKDLPKGGHVLDKGGRGGQMYFGWGGAGPTNYTSYLCVAR